MAQQATFSIPLRNYRTGEKTLQSAIPDWVRKIRLELARCTDETPNIWPNETTKVGFELEASFDGGATWLQAGAWEAFGGIFVRRDGTQAQTSWAEFPYPGGGVARATFIVENGPCRTQGVITVTDS